MGWFVEESRRERLERLSRENQELADRVSRLQVSERLMHVENNQMREELGHALAVIAQGFASTLGPQKAQELERFARSHGEDDPPRAVADALTSVARSVSMYRKIPDDLLHETKARIVFAARLKRPGMIVASPAADGNVVLLDSKRSHEGKGSRR